MLSSLLLYLPCPASLSLGYRLRCVPVPMMSEQQYLLRERLLIVPAAALAGLLQVLE